MNRKRLLTTAAGMLLSAAIAGGVANATIPGPGNVYSACILKGVGTIRLIDKSLPSTNLMSHCTDKETEISWNQAGQPGPPGPRGRRAPRANRAHPARTEPTERTASASRPHRSRRAPTAPTVGSS
jgi:hypothetical protein